VCGWNTPVCERAFSSDYVKPMRMLLHRFIINDGLTWTTTSGVKLFPTSINATVTHSLNKKQPLF